MIGGLVKLNKSELNVLQVLVGIRLKIEKGRLHGKVVAVVNRKRIQVSSVTKKEEVHNSNNETNTASQSKRPTCLSISPYNPTALSHWLSRLTCCTHVPARASHDSHHVGHACARPSLVRAHVCPRDQVTWSQVTGHVPHYGY